MNFFSDNKAKRVFLSMIPRFFLKDLIFGLNGTIVLMSLSSSTHLNDKNLTPVGPLQILWKSCQKWMQPHH